MNLTIRKWVAAPPERVFELWTRPELVRTWWGPEGVTCTAAEIDLRVGGRYRIANSFPDGRTVWIAGAFERIERPRLLIYSWQLEPGHGDPERVTIRFDASGNGTEVVVVHEQIEGEAEKQGHERGWFDCLMRLGGITSAQSAVPR
jgi:uncharacterized protein YndB with AHSA1/START domain